MRKTISPMLTILAVLAVILTGCERKDSEAESEAQTETSKKTPEFTLKSFGGKEISLSDYKGKIVVLEWFNDECPYVRHQCRLACHQQHKPYYAPAEQRLRS